MIVTVITATLTFLLLDAIWLGWLAKQMYIDAFGSILRLSNGNIQADWAAALIVYIALISGLLVLVIPRANGSVLRALLFGTFFGFVTYATYDFTNLAVLKDWSWKVSIIDTLWGMTLCGVTSAVCVLVANKM